MLFYYEQNLRMTSCQGRRQKNFQGEPTEKDIKIPKNSSLFQGGWGATEKRPKNCKKRPKNTVALLSLDLLYLYHIWKSGEGEGGMVPPCPPVADVHASCQSKMFMKFCKIFLKIFHKHNFSAVYSIILNFKV